MAEYINRDSLISQLEKYLRPKPWLVFRLDNILLLLQKSPAADVVEVKHGYWKEPKGGGYQCSNCRAFFDDYYGFSAKEKCIYCPTCGAKMDLKEGATNDT